MKIDSGKLKDFIQKVTMNGSITSILMNFGEEGVDVILKSLDNTTATIGKMNKTAFSEYVAIGEVGLKNVKNLITKLKTLSGMATIDIQNNRFIIYNIDNLGYERTWTEPVVKKDFVDNVLEAEPTMPFDGGVNIDGSILKEMVSNKIIVDSEYLTLTIKDKELTLITGEDEREKSTLKMKCEYKDFSSKFGSVLDTAIAILGDNINMACADAYPIRFITSTEDYTIKLIVAPCENK